MNTNTVERLIAQAVDQICDEASDLIDGAGTTEGVREQATKEISFIIAFLFDKHQAELAEVYREILSVRNVDIIYASDIKTIAEKRGIDISDNK